MIQSPNFPSLYPASKQCVYVIALDPGKAIRLDFLTFDVEGSADCRYDYVEVFTFLSKRNKHNSCSIRLIMIDSRWRYK